jgi:hypothetical protein
LDLLEEEFGEERMDKAQETKSWRSRKWRKPVKKIWIDQNGQGKYPDLAEFVFVVGINILVMCHHVEK